MKLDHKILGPFEVIGNKWIFFKLQLPQSMKIHNVFPTNLSYKTSLNPLSNQVNKCLLSIIINNEKNWEVEEIFNARGHRDKLQYRVKWVSLDEGREWYYVAGFENS